MFSGHQTRESPVRVDETELFDAIVDNYMGEVVLTGSDRPVEAPAAEKE
jgi:hypothetical protein